MTTFLYLLLGVVLAIVYIGSARNNPRVPEMQNYTTGLTIAALIYIWFAYANGAGDWLGLEIVGVVIYGGVAWLGLRYSPLLIGVGWLLHPLWDAVIHPLYTTEFVPNWYALACISFDLVMGIYIGYRVLSLKNQPKRL